MFLVVAYDIAKDSTRSKVSDILEDYGLRVQKSLFELDLNRKTWRRIRNELHRLPLDEMDSIRVYSICANCFQSIEMLGNVAEETQPLFYLV